MEPEKKDEAIEAKETALKLMQNKDFIAARKSAIEAQQLWPDLDNIVQIIHVCDVHCSVTKSGYGDETDWYKILNVDPTADEASIKRQYNKMALTLHPDKNKFPGAAEAFQLICKAKDVLTSYEKRSLYDHRCKGTGERQRGTWSYVFPSSRNQGDQFDWEGGFARFSSNYTPQQSGYQQPDQPRANGRGPRLNKSSKTSKRTSISTNASTAMKRSKTSEVYNPSNGRHSVRVPLVPGSKILEYYDGEFHDFEKPREKKCFSARQIWAVYDTLDSMPRFYAMINKVISKDFKVEVTWLEPVPNNEDERQWLYQGLPACLGKFKLGHSEIIEDHGVFSHIVNWRSSVSSRDVYEIYPKTGETWAVFKNWDIKDVERHKVYEFELVEIVTEYFPGLGVRVAYLGKTVEYCSTFGRIVGKGVDSEAITDRDRFRFSHKIPSFPVTVNEGPNEIKSCFELDPASVPSNFSTRS